MISHFFLGAAFLATFLWPPFLPPFLAAVFFTFLEAAFLATFLAILGAGAAAAATLRATEND